jgi:hypothetical protein
MNRRTRGSVLFIVAGLVLALATSGVLAGTTGKIVGKVTDAKTGEGLPGANVIIVGTKMGAATDLDGSFVIINVPVGTYTVSASMIGYRTSSATGVRSIQDLTTRQDYKMEVTVISGKEIVVTAQRPLIERSATTTTRITTTKEIEAMPVTRPQDVVAVTAGSVGSGNNIYIRGGRRDEVAYFMDGLSINDAVVGGSGLNINKLAIQEVMVQTGGFSAEYGEALSGIVNVVTKEGGDRLSGVLRLTTDQFLGPVSNHYNLYEGSVGGPVPGVKALKYFFSSQLTLTDNRRPMFLKDTKTWQRIPIKRNADGTVDRSALQGNSNPSDPNNPWWSSNTPWIWADTLPNPFSKADSDSVAIGHWDSVKVRRIAANVHDGWKLSDQKWYNPSDEESYQVQGKLAYSFNPNMKLTLGGNYSRDQFIPLRYDDNDLGFEHWKYALANSEAQLTKGGQGNVTWRHQIGKKTFYTLSVNYFQTSVLVAPLSVVADEARKGKWWQDYRQLTDHSSDGLIFDDFSGRQTIRSIDDNPYGVSTGELFYGGVGRLYNRTYQHYWGFKGDFTHEVGRLGALHEFRGGAELKRYRIDNKYNSLPWDPNAFRDYYFARHPYIGDAYILDKMEF